MARARPCPTDYAALSSDPMFMRLLSAFATSSVPEEIVFSDAVIKINRKDKPQERVLLVTDKALYNLNKQRKVKRRIPLHLVEGITVSLLSDEFVIHVPSEYDYRISAGRKDEAVECLASARAKLTGVPTSILDSAQVNLKTVTATRTQTLGRKGGVGASPALTAMGAPVGGLAQHSGSVVSLDMDDDSDAEFSTGSSRSVRAGTATDASFAAMLNGLSLSGTGGQPAYGGPPGGGGASSSGGSSTAPSAQSTPHLSAAAPGAARAAVPPSPLSPPALHPSGTPGAGGPGNSSSAQGSKLVMRQVSAGLGGGGGRNIRASASMVSLQTAAAAGAADAGDTGNTIAAPTNLSAHSVLSSPPNFGGGGAARGAVASLPSSGSQPTLQLQQLLQRQPPQTAVASTAAANGRYGASSPSQHPSNSPGMGAAHSAAAATAAAAATREGFAGGAAGVALFPSFPAAVAAAAAPSQGASPSALPRPLSLQSVPAFSSSPLVPASPFAPAHHSAAANSPTTAQARPLAATAAPSQSSAAAVSGVGEPPRPAPRPIPLVVSPTAVGSSTPYAPSPNALLPGAGVGSSRPAAAAPATSAFGVPYAAYGASSMFPAPAAAVAPSSPAAAHSSGSPSHYNSGGSGGGGSAFLGGRPPSGLVPGPYAGVPSPSRAPPPAPTQSVAFQQQASALQTTSTTAASYLMQQPYYGGAAAAAGTLPAAAPAAGALSQNSSNSGGFGVRGPLGLSQHQQQPQFGAHGSSLEDRYAAFRDEMYGFRDDYAGLGHSYSSSHGALHPGVQVQQPHGTGAPSNLHHLNLSLAAGAVLRNSNSRGADAGSGAGAPALAATPGDSAGGFSATFAAAADEEEEEADVDGFQPSNSSGGEGFRGGALEAGGGRGVSGASPPPVTGWSRAETAVSLDSFELLRVIGRGSYGKVLQVRKRDSGEVFAMKVLSKALVVARNQVEHTQAERAILESIDHPFLIKLRYAFQTPTKLYLVLPYLRGGEVFYHLKQKRKLDEPLARFYLAEVVLGIGHLHAVGIVYRDIKPENVLLEADGHIKLTDFGLSKVLAKPSDTTKTFCGTPEYLAPEVVDGLPHDKGVDWWGLGILMWEFLTGLPPFYNANVQVMYDLIRTAELVYPPGMSPLARDLIAQLLERNPTLRLGNRPGDLDVEAVKAHPWFQGIYWDALYRKEIEPPWRPPIRDGPTDTSNFDREFTNEPVMDSVVSHSLLSSSAPRFDGFTYHAPSQLGLSVTGLGTTPPIGAL